MNKGCLIGLGALLLLMTGGLAYYFTTQNDSGPERFETVKPEIVDVINKAVATGSIKPRLEVNVKPQAVVYTMSSYVEEIALTASEYDIECEIIQWTDCQNDTFSVAILKLMLFDSRTNFLFGLFYQYLFVKN